MPNDKKQNAPKTVFPWVPLVTFIGVLSLIYYIDNLYVNFFTFWFLIIINFGFTYTGAIVYAIFFPTYIFAVWAKVGQTAFLAINGFFVLLFLVKSVSGILKALGAGIPEKVEAAHPTPPSGKIVKEMASETGKLTADFLYDPKKTGLVDIPLKRKGHSAIDHMVDKFREIFNH
ncbi:MAG: hypothetical protein AABW72_00165 [archaeon]